nr:mitochondrial 2-oxodicarboxylate carrier isoform X3 [Equus asinus]
MHPLDVVKTRFQIQRCATDPNSYKSLGDSFRVIFRTEGLFGFYKGILPPILAETPKRAVKFFTFEQYKKLLGYVSLSPALTFAIAGLGSGLTEAIVVNPFEVVKVGLQANRNKFTEQPSTMSYARHIIKKEGLGLQGLNKGFTATLGRHGVFNMVYFGFYHNVKNILPVNKASWYPETMERAHFSCQFTGIRSYWPFIGHTKDSYLYLKSTGKPTKHSQSPARTGSWEYSTFLKNTYQLNHLILVSDLLWSEKLAFPQIISHEEKTNTVRDSLIAVKWKQLYFLIKLQ